MNLRSNSTRDRVLPRRFRSLRSRLSHTLPTRAPGFRAAAIGGGVSGAVLLFALIFLAACAVGPKYQRPGAPVPPAFKESPPAGWKEAQPSDGVLRGKWWEIYHDPQLNALEEQIDVSNQSVQAAEAQFRQARAAVGVARAALYPVVTGGLSMSAVRTPGSFTGGGQVASTSSIRGAYNLPFSLSWEPDLWNNLRRAVAANSALAQASAAGLAGLHLLFQAELAQAYFEIHGLDGDQQVLANTVKSYEEYLQLTKNRYASGVASMADVAQAQTRLETTRAELVDLGVARAQFEHAIAILTGRPPAGFSIAAQPIHILPPAVPIGLPSTLLDRRPDIAASERQIAAANEQIGIAQAAYYPSIILSAAGGSETTHFLEFLTWPSRYWSVGAELAQTIYERGRRRGFVREAQAAYDATVASYRQTVLNAFQQVEDSLSALRVLAEETGVQNNAVKAAQDSLTISTAQYKGGVVSYLQVITAQTALLQNQRTSVDILTRRMVASVQLIEALGGGWDASQLPTAKQLMAGAPQTPSPAQNR